MAKLSMREVREIREMVKRGFPITEIAKVYKVSATTVRNYTKGVKDKLKIS